MQQELTFGDVPLARVLTPGMRVTGLLHSDDGLLDISESVLVPTTALASYAIGDVVLARVRAVTPDTEQLDLHPLVAVSIDVADVSSSPLDELTSPIPEPAPAPLGRPTLTLLDRPRGRAPKPSVPETAHAPELVLRPVPAPPKPPRTAAADAAGAAARSDSRAAPRSAWLSCRRSGR